MQWQHAAHKQKQFLTIIVLVESFLFVLFQSRKQPVLFMAHERLNSLVGVLLVHI
jgi:hypothetical protein